MTTWTWVVWFDPEDNSTCTTLKGNPHYGSDRSYPLGSFETTAATVDEHFDKMRPKYESVMFTWGHF